ncbi:MAG: MBL fold metallo-hydrolase [Polyangiales bacterium]|nr:MBL fold metallo-hydrolase [Sandaracinaceae bacterium]
MAQGSDHFDGRRFFNQHASGKRHSSSSDTFKWFATRKRPKITPVPSEPGSAPVERVMGPDVRVTWVGHATVLLQHDGLNMLTDPIWAERCSPFVFAGPKRFRAPGIRFEDLPPIDVVLLSHDHYDHLCVWTLQRLQTHSAPIIVTGKRVGEVLARNGIGNVVELDWWESTEVAPGVLVVFTPAQHFSGRSLTDLDKRLWGGLYVHAPAGGIYYAGDTGYCPHFREVRERLGSPRVALLPIGAFEPRWFMSPVHMDPAQAVQAHLDLGAVTSVAVHYGSFALADDAQGQPERELTAALTERKVSPQRFRMIEHGLAVTLPRNAREHGEDARP